MYKTRNVAIFFLCVNSFFTNNLLLQNSTNSFFKKSHFILFTKLSFKTSVDSVVNLKLNWSVDQIDKTINQTIGWFDFLNKLETEALLRWILFRDSMKFFNFRTHMFSYKQLEFFTNLKKWGRNEGGDVNHDVNTLFSCNVKIEGI